MIFSILAYLGGFNKLWDSKAGDGETPEPADIYEQAAEIFLLPTKRQFVKDLSSLHDDLQKQYRLKLQGLYGDILKLLGVEDERRLFYVGLTRAKKFLFVTTSRQPVGKINQKKPLSFFTELDDVFFTTAAIANPTKRKRLPPSPSLEEYRFPTSYSELSDYIRCEYDYKMRYVYGFNPIIVQALGYGNQVHNLLNLLHKMAQQTGQVHLEEEASELLQAHFSLRYAAREQEETLKKSALRSILRYLNLWREDFSLSVKTERPFEMDLDNALLTGTIDLLRRENGDSDILEIIDFKTGNERKDREALDLQVQLYTVAARDALNLNVRKAHVHFRGKSDDHLWFTFFHEAGHILLHGKRAAFVDLVEGKSGLMHAKNAQEAEANSFAMDFLIPPSAYRTFREAGQFGVVDLRRFAKAIGIAPGIVVGRLQHDGAIPFHKANSLKQHFTFA